MKMETLTASVIALVSPYLAKGTEEFAKEVGGAAFETVKALVERLRKWWSGDPVAAAAAENLAKEPEEYASLLGQRLNAALAKDKDLAADLTKLASSAGPYAEIVQNIQIANGVTGAKIKSVVDGHLKIVQTMGAAVNTTGLEADSFGKHT
jgi:hypothetical protein